MCVDIHHILTSRYNNLAEQFAFAERFARKQQIPKISVTQLDFKTIKNQTLEGGAKQEGINRKSIEHRNTIATSGICKSKFNCLRKFS